MKQKQYKRLRDDILSEEETPRDFDKKIACRYLNRKVPVFVRELLTKQDETDMYNAFK